MEMDSFGMKIYYIDCREKWDMYVEVHKPMKELWQTFADMAESWDGGSPVVPMM